MKLWLLKVGNFDSPDWTASTYKGNVIVRAEDELAARRQASACFSIASNRSLGEPIRATPWTQAAIVECETYHGTEHSNEGEPCVLFPAET